MTMYSPRFCYANYITSDDITVDSNTAAKDRLIDRNPERRWVSISGDETATFTFTVTKEIDTIVLENTNMSVFTIKYNTSTDFTPALSNSVVSGETINVVDGSNNFLVDGSANFIVSAGIASRVYNNFYFKVGAVTPGTNVVITVTATTDSMACKLGQAFIGKEILELASAGSMRVKPQLKQYNKEMSDGTTNKIYVRTTFNYDLTLNNVTPQERANLMLLADINRRESFYFIARPAMGTDYFDGLAGHMNWINGFDLNNYYNDLQGNGFTGVMKMSQASGIS